MATPLSYSPQVIALSRFGLGARPGEAPPTDPQGWLRRQIDAFDPAPAALAGLPGADHAARRSIALEAAIKGKDRATRDMLRQAVRKEIAPEVAGAIVARAELALRTPAPFIERMVAFWSNHFAISAERPEVAAYALSFERDAIRPHVLGRFESMVLAVERHPAMQIYLDQVRSTGPASAFAGEQAARRPDRAVGLNENLAREILELHSMGARSGYTQQDVTELARSMTGWTISGLGIGISAAEGEPGAFLFRPALHQPGSRTVLGRVYAQGGQEQAAAILGDLAGHPATARHIATKLAGHFAGDQPPPAMVDRLANVFRTTGGNLPDLYRALIDSPEAWRPAPAKFRTPWDWMIAALRGLGRASAEGLKVNSLLAQLGQRVWQPGSPAGWDDLTASWASPDGLLRRVEIAQRLAGDGANMDPRALAAELMRGSLSPGTAAAIARAESPASGLALLLVAPEFMWR